MDNFEKFTSTYSGRHLLEKHSLSEAGVWEVRGEDSNCDMGGSHYMPYLGTYEGKLRDVINIAVDLPRFWTWGAGGDITKISIVKVDANSYLQRAEKKKQLDKAEAQVAALKKELGLK